MPAVELSIPQLNQIVRALGDQLADDRKRLAQMAEHRRIEHHPCFCPGPWLDAEPADRPETKLGYEHESGSKGCEYLALCFPEAEAILSWAIRDGEGAYQVTIEALFGGEDDETPAADPPIPLFYDGRDGSLEISRAEEERLIYEAARFPSIFPPRLPAGLADQQDAFQEWWSETELRAMWGDR